MRLSPQEMDLLKTVLEYLAWRNIPAWRINAGEIKIQEEGRKDRYFKGAPTGFSDIIGILPVGEAGVFLAIETKVSGRKATPAQTAFLERVRTNGGVAFVAYSLEDVEKNINEALSGIPVVNQEDLQGIPNTEVVELHSPRLKPKTASLKTSPVESHD